MERKLRSKAGQAIYALRKKAGLIQSQEQAGLPGLRA